MVRYTACMPVRDCCRSHADDMGRPQSMGASDSRQNMLSSSEETKTSALVTGGMPNLVDTNNSAHANR